MSKKSGRIVPSPTRLPYLIISDGAGHYFKLPVLTSTQRDALTAVTGMAIWNSTTTQAEEYNGSAWVATGKVYGDATFLPLAGGALTGDVTVASTKTIDGVDVSVHAVDFGLHTKIVYKTADETINNNATVQNDDHLYFAVAANEVWFVEVALYCIGKAAEDIQCKLAVPSGATGLGAYWSMGGVYALTVALSYALLDDVLNLHKTHYLVLNSTTAGNIQVQWAQLTAGATDLTVKIGSFIRATRLA